MAENELHRTNVISYNNKTDCYLDIAFSALWDNIPITKSYIENALLIGNINNDDICKIGTAVSELMENATKYSHKNGIQIIIIKPEGSSEIEIVIYNYTDKCNAERLLKRVEEMNTSNSFDYYIYRMKESIKNKEKDAGLGLARVYHESNARITTHYDLQNELVEVKAVIKV